MFFLKFFFFIIPAIILLLASIYFYIFYNRIFRLILKKRKIIQCISIVGTIITIRFAWPVYGWGGVVVFHLLFLALIMEFIHFLLKKITKKRELKIFEFLYRSGIPVFLVMILIFSYGYFNMRKVYETHYQITTKKLNAKEKIRIALISDLHLGVTIDAKKLQTYCQKIQEKKPDMILLDGDIFDEHTERSEMEKAARLFGNMKSTYGTYYVFGNHDSNLYVETPNYSAEELKNTLLKAGVHVLEDDVVSLGKEIYLIGRKDASNENRNSLSQIMGSRDKKKFIILMDHQPVSFQESQKNGIDLQLSGHTHAGQIWPTGQLMQMLGISDLNYGHQKNDQFHAIVTSGIGGWGYPVRTGGHCEYVILDITKKH